MSSFHLFRYVFNFLHKAMPYFCLLNNMDIYISFINLILAVLLLFNNWKVNKNSIYLALLIVLISTFSLTHYLVIDGRSPMGLAITFNNMTPFWCLTGPCLFFYIRSILIDSNSLRWKDFLHTIPFWITLIGVFPYWMTPFEYKLEMANGIINDMNFLKTIKVNWLLSQEINLLVRPILQIGYALACLNILIRFNLKLKKKSHRPQKQGQFITRWLFSLTIFVLCIGIYSLSALLIYYKNPNLGRNVVYEYQFVYIIGVVLIFLPFFVIIFPEILYGIPRYGLKLVVDAKQQRIKPIVQKDSEDPAKDTDGVQENIKNTDSAEQTDPFQELSKEILVFFEKNKPFLKHDFSLDDLATLLNVPKHHLYYCFRNVMHTKFTRLRTDYRIEHAKKLLQEIDLRTSTLDAVGRKSGFPSRSSFYNTFKEEVGCSPGEYVEKTTNSEI